MPLELTTQQQTLIDLNAIQGAWRFRIENAAGSQVLFLSTDEITADPDAEAFLMDNYYDQWFLDDRFFAGDAFGLSHAAYDTWFPGDRFFNEEHARDYEFGVVEFSGVSVSRTNSENGIFTPGDMSLCISNQDNCLDPDAFVGGTVHVALSLSDGLDETVIRRWLFRIKSAEPGYQKIYFTCEDFLQKYLRGSYPNTRLVKDLFVSNDINPDDAVCVPEPYGTCYVPLRSAYKSGLLTETANDISATASSYGSRCTFTRAAGWDKSYEVGRQFTISGFTYATNNGTFTLLAVNGNDLEIDKDAGLSTESAGDTVTIIQGSRPYILGPAEYDYTIHEVRSPRDRGKKSEWESASFAFTQHTFTDVDGLSFTGFLPVIADVDADGTADAPGYWKDGDIFSDMPTRFSRSDTVNMTNPADVIKRVLINMGVPAGRIDIASFAAAKAVFELWGLEFNGAFWSKQDRTEVLRILLAMCHSYLTVTDHIELHVYSAASQKTILKKDVVGQVQGEGSFSYRDVLELPLSDCGYIAYQEAGEAQDKFYKVLVPAKGISRTEYSDEVLPIPFVQDSQKAQKLGTLYFQRKLMIMAEIEFTAQPTCLSLCPGDIITLDDWDYGGRYDALIDSIRYNKDLSLSIIASRYSVALDDWNDLTKETIVPNTDDTAEYWSQPVGGPLSAEDLGRQSFEIWGLPYLVVGPNANRAPFTNIQEAVNALLETRHHGVFILNGEYEDVTVEFPDRSMEIKGESEAGVILKQWINPSSRTTLFRQYKLGERTFKFSNFTVESQSFDNGGGDDDYAWLFYLKGTNTTTSANKANSYFNNITINMKDVSPYSYGDMDRINADYGIYARYTTGKVVLQDIKFNGGSYGLKTYHTSDVVARNIICDNVCAADMYISYSLSVTVDTLISTEFHERCLIVAYYPSYTFSVTNVLASSKNLSEVEYQEGIVLISIQRVYCAGNRINIKHSTTSPSHYSATGFEFRDVIESTIQGNVAAIDVSEDLDTKGFHLNGLEDSTFKGNKAKVDNTDTTMNHYGIYGEDCLNNVIAGNQLDLVNNNAQDIGIELDSGSYNNQGGDNITANCGTGIVLPGGNNNTITGKDI